MEDAQTVCGLSFCLFRLGFSFLTFPFIKAPVPFLTTAVSLQSINAYLHEINE